MNTRNRFLSVFIGIALFFCPVKAQDFNGGYGTEASPYIIASATDLADLASLLKSNATYSNYASKYYKLVADIDLSDYYNWEPIGSRSPFSGTFDGNGKKITNLNINYSSSDNNIGLFGIINNGVVKNLGLENVYIDVRNNNVGGIAGNIEGNSTITNCYVTGSIRAYYVDTQPYVGGTNIGGVVGLVDNSTIRNCYVTATVKGFHYVGGIAGNITANSNVSNCYVTNSIEGECCCGGSLSYSIGGVVGKAEKSTINNIYAIGKEVISCGAPVGGILGEMANSSITNCYVTSTVNGKYCGIDNGVGGVVGGGITYKGIGTGTVKDCVALNPSIKCNNELNGVYGYGYGRIIGSTYVSSSVSPVTLSGNVAFADMLVNSNKVTDGTATNKNGLDKTVAELQTASGFSTTFLQAPWVYENGKLPGFETPVYMPCHLYTPDEKYNITNAQVTLSPSSYIYDGTAKRPTVTAELCRTLVGGIDYTLSYNNTINAGIALVTIAGQNSYNGIKNVTYEIAKATGSFVNLPSIIDATYVEETTLANIILTEGYAWNDSNTKLNLGTHDYDAIYTHPSGNYENAIGKITVNAIKANSSSSSSSDSNVQIEISSSSSSDSNTLIFLPQTVIFNSLIAAKNSVVLQVQKTARLEVYDLKGELKKALHFNNGIYTIQFSALPNGLYVVKATFGNEKKILRMVVSY
jgi:hypothetical protein